MNSAGGSELSVTAQLVEAAQHGDRDALEQLFARHFETVRRIVALRLGKTTRDLEEYDDIVQDTMLRALRNLDRFEHRSEGSFRNWLAFLVRSAVIDGHRVADADKRGGGRVRRLSECGSSGLSASLFRGYEPTPSQIARAKEFEQQVEEALLALEEHHREAVILRRLCEMSYREVADALGYEKEATARQICHRALVKLRALLEL